jgi:hypothetical protein
MTGAVRAAFLGLVVSLPGAAASGAAPASVESGLSHCAAISQADTRLACYDALAGRAPHDQASVPERSAAAPVATATAAATPAVNAAANAAPPVDPAAATRNFGLSAAQLHTADQGPQAIEAHIAKIIVDQNQHGIVVLDNGQYWKLLEGEMLMDAGEAVTISRAALGSFMLTSASHHSYHVHRIR